MDNTDSDDGWDTGTTETTDSDDDWDPGTTDATTTDTGDEWGTDTDAGGESTAQQSPVDQQPAANTEAQQSAQGKGVDEEFCASCGATIKKNAEICPECGVRTGNAGASGPNEKDSGVAAIISFLIPGGGQLYNGQMGRGAAIIVGYMAFWFVTILAMFVFIGFLMMFLAPLFHIVAAWDAYSQAEKINKGEVTV